MAAGFITTLGLLLQFTDCVTAWVIVTIRATVTLLLFLHHAISTARRPALVASVPRLVKEAGPFVFLKETVEILRAAVAEAACFGDIFTHEAKRLIFTNAGRMVMPNAQVVPELVDHERRKQEDILVREGFDSRRKAT